MYIIADGSKHHRLRKPPGKRLVPATAMRKKWGSLYDSVSEKLLVLTPLGYTQHSKLRVDYDKEPDQDIINPIIPAHAVPVDTTDRPYTWSIMNGWKPHSTVYSSVNNQAATSTDPCEETRFTTVRDQVTTGSLAPWEKLLLQHLDVTDTTEDTIWLALTNTTCHIATDGSAPSGKGSFAWVISNGEGQILAHCHGPVFGAKISSYRSEAYGILSVLRFLLKLSQLRGGDNGDANQLLSHTLLCDNRSLILRINDLKQWKRVYPNVTMEPEWDVLAEIRATLQDLNPVSQPTFEHIKGHQDLPLQAQLNCKADKLAETYLKDFPNIDHSTVPLLPTAGCHLHLGHGTITHDIKRELPMARAVPQMKAKLCHKNVWTEDEFEQID